MFDNLRDDTASMFYEDEDLFPEEELVTPAPKRQPSSKLFGMTPVQRFVISVMLMVAVFTLGTMCLLLTGRIGLY